MIRSLHSIFSREFNSTPEFGIRAPGRINLIGEHIDYLDGFVMPMAIDRAVYALVALNQTGDIRFWSSITNQVDTIATTDSQIRKGEEFWMNYVVGVLSAYRDKGIDCLGFDIALSANLPTGAGLSASAALETIIALAIERVSGHPLDVAERAKLCQQAEHEYADVPCGIMDQMAVGACEKGKALMLDCQNNTTNSTTIPEGIAVVVTDTRVKHALGDGEYKNRCEDCAQALAILSGNSWREINLNQVIAKQESLGDRLFRRARHAVTEIARVGEFATALDLADAPELGRLLRASHDSLRDDFEVSCPELDLLVDAAYEFGPDRGLIGARMTGGGFGGSTISLVKEQASTLFIEHLTTRFEAKFNAQIEPFVTTPSAGASYIEL